MACRCTIQMGFCWRMFACTRDGFVRVLLRLESLLSRGERSKAAGGKMRLFFPRRLCSRVDDPSPRERRLTSNTINNSTKSKTPHHTHKISPFHLTRTGVRVYNAGAGEMVKQRNITNNHINKSQTNTEVQKANNQTRNQKQAK